MELSKPLDASDVTAEDAKSEVVRLRTQLRSLMIESLEGGLVPDTFSTGGKPIEWETGGEITTSLILLHGVTMPASAYVDGDFPKHGWKGSVYYAFKPLLAGTPGLRVVLPQAGEVVSKELLSYPMFGGAKSIISWTNQAAFPPKTWFDFSRNDLVGCIKYIHSLIDKEVARGVSPSRIFIAGHSQGGMVGARAALTYASASLGGLMMLSSVNASEGIAEDVAPTQKGLKILAMHCRDDMAWNFDNTMKSYELLKAATGGEDNFTLVEMPDSPKDTGCHSPMTPTSQQHIVDFLGGQMPSAK